MRGLIILVLASGALLQPAAAADKPKDIAAAGKVHLELRLRTEAVDESGLPKDALATTLRTRLSWTSAAWQSWQATVEFDDIHALDDAAYNSTINGQSSRPVVADPVGTELNRAVLEWKSKTVDVALGRQRLLLDDQRFIGNVGWRQNEQTFDAASVRWQATPRAELRAAWIANVNRVFGPRSGGAQAANWHGDTLILNGKLDLARFGTLSAFWYGLDFDNARSASSATAGLRWNGKVESGGWRWSWTASLAHQNDYGRNPVDYSASYHLVELGAGRGPVTFRVGHESLGGDASRPERRFQTPLATLHAFDGWADKFLTTPAVGLEDLYLGFDANYRGFKGQISWHDFRAEAVDRSLGREWDLTVSRKLSSRYELLAKYADYTARGFATDTRKGWLMLTVTL